MFSKTLFKNAFLLVIGLLLSQIANSQENFQPGYLISLSGDSVHGLIDYRNWDRNPDKISFKDLSTGKVSSYTPMTIKKFGVLDEIYESAYVETEVSPDITNDLENTEELNIETVHVFLQTMIKGEKSLFYLKNKAGKDQFYIRNNTDFDLLIYKRYFKVTDDGKIITENRRYLNQLALYLHDCPDIQGKLKTTAYYKPNMERLFNYYIKSTHSEINFQKAAEKVSVEWGAEGGVTQSTLKINGGIYRYQSQATYPMSVNPMVGISANVVFPKNRGKFSIYNELVYNKFSTSGIFRESDRYAPENNFTVTYIDLAYSYLKMINQLRFKYLLKNCSLFVNGGCSNGFALSQTNHKRIEATFYQNVTVTEGDALVKSRTYAQGYTLGVGAYFNKFVIEGRMEKGNGMSSETSMSTYTTIYSLLLTYRLK